MNPKINLSRTRVVIITLVCTMVCAAAALIAFKHWPVQNESAGPVNTKSPPNHSSETEGRTQVDGPVALRDEEARKSLRLKTNDLATQLSPTTTHLLNPFKLTPLSNNGLPTWLTNEEQSDEERAAFNQSLNTPVERTKAGSPDPTESERSLTSTGSEKAEREREGLESEEEARGDRPDEAAKFRNLQLQDENGVIPLDGLQKARQQMDVMRAAQESKAQAAGKPNGIEVAAIDPGEWTWLGPGNVGGRIRSIVIDPTNANNMWVGSVSGGIWNSTNAGVSWAPVNDFMANLAVTTIVIDPTNSSVMYAGTGEAFPTARQCDFNCNYGVTGAGVFKSTNAGVTWNQLSSTNPAAVPAPGCGVIGAAPCPQFWSFVNRLAISPDGTTILAATNSGILHSTFAGTSWTTRTTTNVLDIDFRPGDSTQAVAGELATARFSNDGGLTWNDPPGPNQRGGVASFSPPITLGTTGNGRIELAYAANSPFQVVFAAVNNNNGDIYRSINGGTSFTRMNVTSTSIFLGAGNQGGYDNTIWVNPQDSTFVVVGGIDLWRSTDSGQNFSQISRWQCGPGQTTSCAGSSAHADHHVIVADPGFNNTTNRRVYFGNDGGMFRADDVSTVAQQTGWEDLNHGLGITQFFGGAASGTTIIGGAQDNSTLRYTGNAQNWSVVFGGDGGYCAADPTDSSYFYGEYPSLQIFRSTDGAATVSYIYCNPVQPNGGACTGTGITDTTSANFVAPLILDPNNSNTMLAGSMSLWRSNDIKAAGLPTWTAIKPPASDGLIPPSTIPISAIAVSPNNSDFIVIGDNSGRIYLTFDGTGSNPVPDGSPCSPSNSPCWSRIDSGVPARFVTRLVIDNTRSPNWIYATLGGYAADNVYRTTDLGTTWTDVSGAGPTGLPSVPVRTLTINPVRPDLLYVGTEVGIFASEDAGATWSLPQDGPANVSVDDLLWLNGDLVAVTHGRGLYKSSTPIYNLPLCAPPPDCQCFGDWDCPCTWNSQHVPTFNDDIGIPCPVTLKPGQSNGGKARNMRVEAALTLNMGLTVTGDVANFGSIANSPGMVSGFTCRNLLNSRPAGVSLAGVISLLGGISASGDVTNSGIIALGQNLECNNLTTTPPSTLTMSVLNVKGNVENFGHTEAQSLINVVGDQNNGGLLKAPFLVLTAPPTRIKKFSGAGQWQFGGLSIPVGFTVSLGSDITLDIANLSNNGTFDFSNRTLNFKGSLFQGAGIAAGTGTLRFVPTSGNSIFNANGAAVTIASGTVEYQSGGTISGPLTIDAGATLAMNTSGSLTATNDVTINGSLIKTGGNPVFIFNGQTIINNGVVGDLDFLTFNNSGTPKSQLIAGIGTWAPRNVQVGGPSPSTATVTLQNNVGLATNQLITAAGSALDVGNFTLTLTGPMNFFSGKISGTGLVKMQPSSGTPRLGTPFSALTIDPDLQIASGTVRATGTTVGGKLTIDAGATLSLLGFVGINANGDVTNNGTLNAFSDNPALNFKGGTFTNNGIVTGNVYVNIGSFFGPQLLQNLAGTGSWAGSPRLLIDSLSTTTLLSDVTYTGGNLFVEGRLNTGPFTLSLPCNVTWSGAGDAVGNIRRTNLAACPGAAIAYGNPFTTIQFTSGTPPTEITVNVVSAAPAGFPNAAQRTYLITPTGGSGYTADLRLHYLDSELNGNAESTLQLWRNNGSSWTPQGVTNRNTTENWVEFTGVTQFSPWAISGPAGPTAATASISGRITSVDGTPVGGVLVTLSGSRTIRTITDNLGQYKFENVEPLGFYTITPARANYSFSPQQLTFSLLADKTDAVFSATPTASTSNPLDTVEFFLRQQYLDFLNREPDQGGLDYWASQIAQCGGDLSCIQHRRIDVSNAFFFEIEYQQTGSYVFRLYRAAYGNDQPLPNPDSGNLTDARKIPRYDVFARDRARVVAGTNQSQAQLDLATAFVQRQEFLSRYPATLGGPEFVDALLARIRSDSGIDLTSQRAALIKLFDEGGRGAVIYRLGDDNAQSNPINNRPFIDSEYNRSFVYTQYAGYLKRDSDISGFLFWLGKVNEFPVRHAEIQHTMVCAFITSAEYQQRFSSIVTRSNSECGP